MEKNGKNYNKISGYLEKKGKRKMMSLYKKYWFVLEGGLLLYYRSKDDYETISPCKGSINLGPPCLVKPCPSLPGVFQIQTRIATVTLRADTLDDQTKWMQAIISEVNPQKTLQRMTHFRYSMENVQQTKDQNPNSTPESQSSHNSHEDIIHRLQKMGAQSYNPIGTINQIATIRRKERPPLPNINFENKLNDRNSKSSEHIYERISAELREALVNDDQAVKEISTKAMTLPPQGLDTLRITKEDNTPNTLIIENDTYAISIQHKDKPESIKTERSKSDKEIKSKTREEKKSKTKLKPIKSFFSKKPSKEDNFIIENDTYSSVDKNHILTKNGPIRDHNENSVIKKELKKFEEENTYSMPNFFNEPDQSEDFYEDIDNNPVQYAEPRLCQADEPDKQLLPTDENEKTKSKIKKKKSNETNNEAGSSEKGAKLQKRSSFIKRVWKRKGKNKEKTEEGIDVLKVEESEELYETVPTTLVEKLCVADTAAVQMLSELQNILEHKMPILMERISSDLNSPSSSNPPEITSETIEEKEECSLLNYTPKIPDPPILPQKTLKSTTTASPCHDIPNNKPVALPPKKKKLETIKSLDQILNELEAQKPESILHKTKVQKLIKRFSEPELSENDVILRNSRRNHIQREDINSDELSRLLNELAKVTNAPILKPGVTSSLNGHNMTDEELSKLLPTKQRRFSEPDYDIPRPHKSLTLISHKKDKHSENVIGSTRFFGPILKPSDMIVHMEPHQSEPSSQLNSITPDSLENNSSLPVPASPSQEQDENPYSHKYYKFVDRRTFIHNHQTSNYPQPILEKSLEDFIMDNEIYAEPKSIQMNFELCDKNVDYDQDDEVFVDSLEVCKNEVSTEF